jgi:hypothetical protein
MVYADWTTLVACPYGTACPMCQGRGRGVWGTDEDGTTVYVHDLRTPPPEEEDPTHG